MSGLPKWAVDNRTSVKREVEPWRDRTPAEHARVTAAACRGAARQLASRADAAQILDYRDPVPASTVAALRRLRSEHKRPA